MADTSTRLLRLLSLLQGAREWSGSELADRLEVSARTVRRDVERLRSLGYPVEATIGAIGGYRLSAGAAVPPLLFEDDEATAIAIGLRTVVSQAVAGVDEASIRALAKLQQVLPARLRGRVNALSAATMSVGPDRTEVDPDLLASIAGAISVGRRLRFEYAAGDGRRSLRLVEPWGLVATGRRWYLVAFDVDRDDWRIYRIDRLRDPRPLPWLQVARPLPAADPAAFVREKLYTSAPTHEAIATLEVPAAEAARRLGDTALEVAALDHARSRVRLASDTIGWLAMRLVLLDCAFTVEEPPELIAYLRRAGGRIARATT